MAAPACDRIPLSGAASTYSRLVLDLLDRRTSLLDPRPHSSNGEKKQRSSESRALPTDGNREAPRPSAATARSPGFLILDKHSRMRFLESALRRRVSRRENTAKQGLRAKFVFFPPLLSEAHDEFSIFNYYKV